ncbi:MAG: hypothetical protein MI924_20955 [Chloroflexales bacterium]|nr:hypothetical protein [Chloroflexales bacterium]
MRINRRLFTLTHGVRRQIAGTVVLGLLMRGTYIGQSILVAVGGACIFSGAAWSTLIPIVLWILALNNGWLSLHLLRNCLTKCSFTLTLFEERLLIMLSSTTNDHVPC